ncbi:RNA editing associated helicase 2 [Perkinsela sp. CCAP 1560/4]|nr:RNA editing associated helicase 2 [Perkinsela sp. CCAP 1560/4]|eukprot:KNH04736.1 RNA editing associated helicase 2 [Perkinsela sp. CCAP 1560/4]
MLSVTIKCALISFLGGIIFGYSCIGVNGVLTKLYSCMLGLIPEKENTWNLGFLISSINFGGLVGSAGVTSASRNFHPCTLLAIGSAFSLCAILSIFCSSYWMHFLTRLLTGIGVGIVSTVCPSYVVEICPVRYRGSLGGLFQVSIALGIAIASIISHFVMGTGRDSGTDHYCDILVATGNSSQKAIAKLHYMFILPNCASLLLGLIALLQNSIWTTRKIQRNRLPSTVSEELGCKTTEIGYSGHDMRRFSFLHRLKKARRAVAISIMAAVALQLTGINAVMYYTFKFLEAANVESKSLGTIFIMLVNFSATLLPLVIADRVGRRPLLLIGLVAMTSCMLLLCLTSNYFVNSSSKLNSVVGFTILTVYIYGFGTGPGFHFWVVCNEVLPTYFSQEGFAIANFSQWAFLILVTFLFPWLHVLLGSFVFLLFVVPGVISLIFFYFCLPETKGLSKHTIEDLIDSASWTLSKPW